MASFRVVNEMKDRVSQESQQPVRTVYNEVLNQVISRHPNNASSLSSSIPSFQSLKSSLQRARNKKNRPALPKRGAALVPDLPADCNIKVGGRADDGPAGERLLFATDHGDVAMDIGHAVREEEDNPGQSEVKVEIDIAEESGENWMAKQAWRTQAITGNECQHHTHTSSEQTIRHRSEENQESDSLVFPKIGPDIDMMEPHDPVLSKVKTEPDSDMMEPHEPVLSKVKTEPDIMEPHDPVLSKVKTEPDIMEPHDPVLSKVKTEPDSDAEGELPVYFGRTESFQENSSEPLAAETVRVMSKTDIEVHQIKNEMPSTQAAQPESPLLAVRSQSVMLSGSTSKTANSSSVIVRDPEKKPENRVCDICNATFTFVTNLKRHMLIHAGGKNHVCEVCHKAFFHLDVLRRHRLAHTGEKTHQCNLCSKAFLRAGDLNKHRLIHTGEKTHVCGMCGKAFFHAGELNKHRTKHMSEKNHVCDVCNKAFKQLRDMTRHKMRHNGERSHACQVCEKVYPEAADLKQHKLTHAGKDHACNVCSKVFVRVCDLNRHKLIHVENRNPVSDVCSQGFFMTADFNKHKLIMHSGPKEHACDVCDKTFGQVGNLKQHLLTHMGEKNHVCEVCNKAFSTAGHLERHTLIHAKKSCIDDDDLH